MGFGTSHDDVEAMAHDPRIICLLFYFGDSMGLLTYATEWFYRAITAVEGGEMVKDALCRASQMMANVEYNVTVFAHYSQHPPVSIYYGTVYGLMED